MMQIHPRKGMLLGRKEAKQRGPDEVISETKQERAPSRPIETRANGSRRTAHQEDGNLTVSVEEARKIILDAARPLGSESVSVMEASDRILYEDVVSDVMIPPVDDSAMDGYAVIAADTMGHHETTP
jgi:hypothetical protein